MGTEQEARLAGHIPALGVLVANTLVVYGPCLLAPTGVWAWPYTGYAGAAWLQWLFGQKLLAGDLGFTTDLVHRPAGVDLVAEFADFGPSILWAPLSLLIDPLVAFNLSLIAQYLLFGICFYALALEVLGDRVGALASALLASHATVVLLPSGGASPRWR